MTVVGIGAVHAEGSDLIGDVVHDDGQGAVFETGFHRMVSVEDLLNLLRQGGGADVPVMRSKSEQAVTDTAADGKSLKARILKSVNDQFSILRYLHIIS